VLSQLAVSAGGKQKLARRDKPCTQLPPTGTPNCPSATSSPLYIARVMYIADVWARCHLRCPRVVEKAGLKLLRVLLSERTVDIAHRAFNLTAGLFVLEAGFYSLSAILCSF